MVDAAPRLPAEHPSRPAASGLRPVAATFVVFGMFWGAWAVAAADVERGLHLSHGAFGAVFSVALIGAAVSNAVGGALTERLGTGRVLGAASLAWAVLLLGGAAARGRAPFIAVLVGVVTIGGLVDVVMNVAAVAGLADRPGALVRFHAFFNAGAAVGAAGMGVVLAGHWSWRWGWVAVGAVMVPVALVSARAGLPAAGSGDRVPLTGALSLLRRDRLVLLACAFGVSAMVEGGIELWGVLFLRRQLSSGLLIGASSAVTAYVVATVARATLGPAAGRRGAARGVTLGAGLAGLGLVLLVVAPAAWMSGVGLVLAAGGISQCWPLLLAHASAGRARPGEVVGAVSAVGYTGFVIGPTVVGFLASAVGLRGGLAILVIGAVFVAASPRLTRSGRRPAVA